MKDDTYYLHQTPPELALKLIEYVPIDRTDTACEPFKGEGAFYNAIRKKTVYTDWYEIEEGRDYKDFSGNADWVVTNPPFQNAGSFSKLLMELASKCNKGMALLGNDYCLSALTPKRVRILASFGLHLSKIVSCNIKKWRGRYYFMIFTRIKSPDIDFLDGYF
jgi:hypothetical protein